MLKKALSLVLCVCMLLSCVPVSFAEEVLEEAAWEEVVVEAVSEEPEPAPQIEEPEEEAPAEEPAVEEEPAEEAPAAEEEPVVEEEPAEEEPAEEPTEEEPTEEDPAEEPTEEEPTEEEPAEEPTEEEPAEEDDADRFAYCYALVKRGAEIYADSNRAESLGQFEKDAIVYVAAREEAEDAGRDMLTIWFAVDGEAQVAYLRARDAQKLEEREIAFPANPVVCDEIRLIEAVIAAVEEAPAEEPTEEEPAEGEPTEEQPAEGEPTEEEPAEEPTEEEPAEEPTEEEPAEEEERAPEAEEEQIEPWEQKPEVDARQTGNGTVTITVTGAPEANGYNVYEIKGGKNTLLKGVANTADGVVEIPLKSVAVGTHVYFAKPYMQVGKNKAEGQLASDAFSLDVQKTPAAPKIKISQDKEREGVVLLSWKADAVAAEYRIVEDEELLEDRIEIENDGLNWTAAVYDAETNADGMTHKYKVYGLTTNGTKGAAGAASIKVVQYWAAAPTMTVAATKGMNEVVITVKPAANYADMEPDGFELFYAPAKGNPIPTGIILTEGEGAEPDWLVIDGMPECIVTLDGLTATLTSIPNGTHAFVVKPIRRNEEGELTYGKASVKKSASVKATWSNAVTKLTAVQDMARGDGVVKLTFSHNVSDMRFLIMNVKEDAEIEMEPIEPITCVKGAYTAWVQVDPNEFADYTFTVYPVLPDKLDGLDWGKPATSKPVAIGGLWSFAPTFNVSYEKGTSRIAMSVAPAYESENPADAYAICLVPKSGPKQLVATLEPDAPKSIEKCPAMGSSCVMETEGLNITLTGVDNGAYTFVAAPVKGESIGKESAKKAVTVSATWKKPATGLTATQDMSEMFEEGGIDCCTVKLTFKHNVQQGQAFEITYSTAGQEDVVELRDDLESVKGTYTAYVTVPADCIADYAFSVAPYTKNGDGNIETGDECAPKKIQIRPLWALVPTLNATAIKTDGIITLTVKPNKADYVADGYEIKYVPSKGYIVTLGTIWMDEYEELDGPAAFPCKIVMDGAEKSMTLYHVNNGTFGFTATPVMKDGRTGIVSLKKTASISAAWKKTATNITVSQAPKMGEGFARVSFKNAVSGVYFNIYDCSTGEKLKLYNENGEMIEAQDVKPVSGVYTVYVELEPKEKENSQVGIRLARMDAQGEDEAAEAKSASFPVRPLWMLAPSIKTPIQLDDGKVRIQFTAGYDTADAYEIVKTVAKVEKARVTLSEDEDGVYTWIDENAEAKKAAIYSVTPIMDGVRGNSASVGITPKADVWKLAPQNLKAVDAGRAAILSWEPQGTAQKYNIYEVVAKKNVFLLSTELTSVRVDNLMPGTHQFIVEPQKGTVKGAKSKPVSVEVSDGVQIGIAADCAETKPGSQIVWTVTVGKGTAPYTVEIAVKDGNGNTVDSDSKTLAAADSFDYAFVPETVGTYKIEVKAKDNSEPVFERTVVSSEVKVYVPDFEVDANGVLTEYRGSDANIVIPKAVMGDEIKAIGANVFKGKTAIKTVKVEAPITEIGASAFEGCTGLTSVSLPDDVVIIRSRAFKGCTSLATMD